jgi:malate dehydrogenase
VRKVSIVGGGNVGASAALYVAESGVADVVLVDIVEGMPQGKALDLLEAAPVRGYDSFVTGSNDYGAIAGSHIVIVTAGFPRKPGMSRLDLLKSNADIVRTASENIRTHAPDAFVIIVTNPLDVMAYLAWKTTGFERRRVMGMAGVLDSTRFRTFVAMELDVSVEDVSCLVLGGHGDSMVPLPRYTTVSGVPITELLPSDAIDRLVKRTAGGGAEIVALLKTGSAFYAPAASAAQMAEAILLDKKRMLPASVLLSGEYGMNDLFCGVPIKLGAGGVEQIIELPLAPDELTALQKSGAEVRQGIQDLGL